MASIIRCGVAGFTGQNWNQDVWSGSVYPSPRPRGFHPLEFLAQHFDAAEIDYTWDRPLREEVSRLWMQKVAHNRDFQFVATLRQRFTQERVLAPTEVATFKNGLRPLLRAGRLGAVIMQFPWAFKFTKENRDFLIELRRAFHEFPLVAELRHSSWLAAEAQGTLIDYRVGFVNLDQPELAKATPPTALLTTGIGFFRFHGRNHEGWFQESDRAGDYSYQDAELASWRQRIEHVRQFADKTFVLFSNNVRGRSFFNALDMQAALDGGAAARRPPVVMQPALFDRFAA